MKVSPVNKLIESFLEGRGRLLISKSEWEKANAALSELQQTVKELRQQNEELRAEIASLDSCRFADSVVCAKAKNAIVDKPIFINTLPKSGSVYIIRKIAETIGVETQPISYGYFPVDLVDIQKLRDLVTSGNISQGHLDPSPTNLKLLSLYLDRWVVHIRDPRQATLSWIHHLNRFHGEGHDETIERSAPNLPSDYFEWEFSQQVDCQIDRFLIPSLSWINGWLSVYDSGKYNILLTTYDEIIDNDDNFVHKIISFFNNEIMNLDIAHIEKNLSVHFRSGDPDEWRTSFSVEQCKRSTQLIPDALMRRFSWK